MSNLEKDSDFAKSFPLFAEGQYDYAYNNSPWPLAISSTAPGDLKKRIAGALVSYTLRLKSVDYAIKSYLADNEYGDGDRERLDLVIAQAIDLAMSQYSACLMVLSGAGDKAMGVAIGEWTLFRAPFSIKQLIRCANQGALFEPLVIARMLLEQLAWAFAAMREECDEKVRHINAQSSLKSLREIIPESGRFYGWLSNHAHWQYDAHIKCFAVDNQRMSHVYASITYKAISLAAGLVITSVYLRSMMWLLLRNDELMNHSLVRDLQASDGLNVSLLRRVCEASNYNADISSLSTVLAEK